MPGLTHGRRSTYNKGCTCELCAEANRAAARERRKKVREGTARSREQYLADLELDREWTTYLVAPVETDALTRAEILAARG